MDEIRCLVDECEAAPLERLTVNEGGLVVIYAVCRIHGALIRDGGMVAAHNEVERGLVGPA